MKSWKTTVAGAVAALGAYFVNLDDPIMQLIGQVLVVVGPVLMGMFAKDVNVTGGSVVQPSTPEVKASITTTPAP